MPGTVLSNKAAAREEPTRNEPATAGLSDSADLAECRCPSHSQCRGLRAVEPSGDGTDEQRETGRLYLSKE